MMSDHFLIPYYSSQMHMRNFNQIYNVMSQKFKAKQNDSKTKLPFQQQRFLQTVSVMVMF